MLRSIILRKLSSVERDLGGSVDYLRFVVRTSLPAFFRFVKVLPLAEFRRRLPLDAHHVARIVATRDEDCGTCVQIEVNLARKAGVAPETIRATLARRPEELPEALGDVYRFAESVVLARYDEGPLRERIRGLYGDTGLVDLALAMAGCRVFPLVKRTLGYAVSCANVEIRA